MPKIIILFVFSFLLCKGNAENFTYNDSYLSKTQKTLHSDVLTSNDTTITKTLLDSLKTANMVLKSKIKYYEMIYEIKRDKIKKSSWEISYYTAFDFIDFQRNLYDINLMYILKNGIGFGVGLTYIEDNTGILNGALFYKVGGLIRF